MDGQAFFRGLLEQLYDAFAEIGMQFVKEPSANRVVGPRMEPGSGLLDVGGFRVASNRSEMGFVGVALGDVALGKPRPYMDPVVSPDDHVQTLNAHAERHGDEDVRISCRVPADVEPARCGHFQLLHSSSPRRPSLDNRARL